MVCENKVLINKYIQMELENLHEEIKINVFVCIFVLFKPNFFFSSTSIEAPLEQILQ